MRGNHFRAELADAFQFGGKIDRVFPIRDLLRHVVADSLDGAQLAALRRQNPLRRFKNFEQLAQTHRPHLREHVERDAGFGAVHMAAAEADDLSLGEDSREEIRTESRRRPARPARTFGRRSITRSTARTRARRLIAFLRSATTAAATAGAENLHVVRHDLELAALLTGLFVVPGIELQPSLDEDRAAFL